MRITELVSGNEFQMVSLNSTRIGNVTLVVNTKESNLQKILLGSSSYKFVFTDGKSKVVQLDNFAGKMRIENYNNEYGLIVESAKGVKNPIGIELFNGVGSKSSIGANLKDIGVENGISIEETPYEVSTNYFEADPNDVDPSPNNGEPKEVDVIIVVSVTVSVVVVIAALVIVGFFTPVGAKIGLKTYGPCSNKGEEADNPAI